jgi:elongation factor P--(R)-beta-lysine ligase
VLSSEIVLDAWLEPFVAGYLPDAPRWREGGEPRYLQTSPEAHMRRLLAAGAEAIYQFSRVFRNGELGRRHNPEFTMLEWYRVGDDHHRQMDFVEELVRSVMAASEPWRDLKSGWHVPESSTGVVMNQRPRPSQSVRACHPTEEQSFERLTYDAAFQRYAGQHVLETPTTELRLLAERHHLVPPAGLAVEDRDGWLNYLLAELVEPKLGRERPTFLYDYPASQAALAKVVPTHPGGPLVAERFELYLDGVELCNGYHELTDAEALRQRSQEQAAHRASAGLRPLPIPGRLLDAMQAGLPPSCGVALGVDRLVMLALGAESLAEVIAFPFDRA